MSPSLKECLFMRSLNIKSRVSDLVHQVEKGSVIHWCSIIWLVLVHNCTDPCISVSFITLFKKCQFLEESFPFYTGACWPCAWSLSVLWPLRSLTSLYCSFIVCIGKRDVVASGILALYFIYRFINKCWGIATWEVLFNHFMVTFVQVIILQAEKSPFPNHCTLFPPCLIIQLLLPEIPFNFISYLSHCYPSFEIKLKGLFLCKAFSSNSRFKWFCSPLKSRSLNLLCWWYSKL